MARRQPIGLLLRARNRGTFHRRGPGAILVRHPGGTFTRPQTATEKIGQQGFSMRRLPSLIALRFFEETARHLSFNRAARVLCVTQGAVSRQIRLLEESLGVKLFERDHKGIRLTPAGVRLMPSVTEAFDVIERGTQQLTGSVERKRLIVSLPPTFATQWLSSRLAALAEQLADVDLSIRTQDSGECHCSVRFGREAAVHGYSELLMIERHALVGSAEFAGVAVE